MPIVNNSQYQAKFPFCNTHINTIYTNLCRKVMPLPYQRERVELPDGDFVDLDWSKKGSRKLAFCVHGLEGHARKHYMAGMMNLFNTEGWDAVGMNLRSCSGEDNRLLQGYHSGQTDDMAYVLNKIKAQNAYTQIVLIGFSVGGNIVFKYVGEAGKKLFSEISHVIGLSAPCDLKSCSMELEKPKNYVYLNQFLITLKQKARLKYSKFPQKFDLNKVVHAKQFRDFDSNYTAPINGFTDCFDYWDKASSLPHLENITVPTLLVNALDDTFLSPDCFPKQLAHQKDNFYLEMPRFGGHLGFMNMDKQGYLYTERRTLSFVNGF